MESGFVPRAFWVGKHTRLGCRGSRPLDHELFWCSFVRAIRV